MFRAPEMMLVGERAQGTVLWGINPNAGSADPNRKQSRVFAPGEDPLDPEGKFEWNQPASDFFRKRVTLRDMKLRRAEEIEDGFPFDDMEVRIEERKQEHLIIRPKGSLELAANAGLQRPVTMKKLN